MKWQSYDDAIEMFQYEGIMLYGTFIFGCDHDTVDAFDVAVDFSIQHKFILANFNPLTPMPGAPLFERMRRDGRLLHDRWWLDPDFSYGDATMRPLGMTTEELTRGCFSARKKFNTINSILKRLIDRRTNLRSPFRAGLFLLVNYVSRREIYKKQNRALGQADQLDQPRTQNA
jgi:radical SAM superfamily enzyme YgiQ (UPF0313 family)